MLSSPQLDLEALESSSTDWPTIRVLGLPGSQSTEGRGAYTMADLSPNFDADAGTGDFRNPSLRADGSNGTFLATLDDLGLVDSAYRVTWLRVLDGQYCLVSVTPEREVTASVVNQLADIERSAYATVQSVVLIASIFFVFLFLCACWTAR